MGTRAASGEHRSRPMDNRITMREDRDMIKVIELIKRKEGMSLEDFSRYWEEEHGPLIARIIPNLRRYVQNHPIKLGSGEPPIDGIAELWFDDFESWRESADWVLGETGKELHEAEEKFTDKSKFKAFICEEKIIKE
jgi:uncharacterized protein (TIGR02118 family)